jgi:hypothetical protein
MVVRSVDGEHPYYLNNNPAEGNINYRGEEFLSTRLLLDIEKDKLIISNPGYGVEMELVKEWIDRFSIGPHQFINIQNKVTLPSGFYEELYDGPTQLLVKRTKQLSEKLYSNTVIRKFDSFNSYFLKSGEQFTRIKSKTDLLKTLSSHKKELKAFIRKNKLFKQSKEHSFIDVVEYFDSLNL